MSRAPLYQLDLRAGFGTWEWDLATDESTFSDELFAILGLAPETARPGPAAYAMALHPDDVARIGTAIDRVRRDGARIEIEHRVRTGGKHLRFVRLRAWRSADHRMLHALVEDTSSPIAERLSSVSAFAAGIAHEITNPLGLVAANVDLIEREGASDTLLRDTRHGIQRIDTIVRGLMTFARVEPTHREPLDLNRVLEVAIGITLNAIRTRAKLVRQFATVPLVEGNAAQLGQVFVNLLLNAAQAIPPGAQHDHEITVTTRTDLANNCVVEVRDTGRGIPRGVGSKVFEAFVTTKPAGAGDGLGLAVCRNLVHAAGGDITFESEPGRTVFRVVLPAIERAIEKRVTDEVSSRRGSVLIVDDEVIFANSLRRLLAREHEVQVAHDGKDALARIRAGERFDVVVSDLMMPGLGGIALYDATFALSTEQAQRFVFVSAGSTGATEFLARVTNPWFDKPCDLGALRAAIRRLVG
ncbi:MAG: ATP-binding protein [Kofleriaceae bacterium]